MVCFYCPAVNIKRALKGHWQILYMYIYHVIGVCVTETGNLATAYLYLALLLGIQIHWCFAGISHSWLHHHSVNECRRSVFRPFSNLEEIFQLSACELPFVM